MFLKKESHEWSFSFVESLVSLSYQDRSNSLCIDSARLFRDNKKEKPFVWLLRQLLGKSKRSILVWNEMQYMFSYYWNTMTLSLQSFLICEWALNEYQWCKNNGCQASSPYLEFCCKKKSQSYKMTDTITYTQLSLKWAWSVMKDAMSDAMAYVMTCQVKWHQDSWRQNQFIANIKETGRDRNQRRESKHPKTGTSRSSNSVDSVENTG